MKQQLKIAKNVAKLAGVGAIVFGIGAIGGMISGYNLVMTSVQKSLALKVSGCISSVAVTGVTIGAITKFNNSKTITNIVNNCLDEIDEASFQISIEKAIKNAVKK